MDQPTTLYNVCKWVKKRCDLNKIILQTSTHAIFDLVHSHQTLRPLPIDHGRGETASRPEQAEAFSPRQMTYVPARRDDQLVGENESLAHTLSPVL